MVRRARREKDHRREHRPRHRRLGRDDLGVDQEAENGQQRGVPPARPGEAQQQEQGRGQHRDVAAGDGYDVVDPALLQPLGGVAIQPGAVADEHRGDDGGRARIVRPHRRVDGPPDERPHPAAPFVSQAPGLDHLDLQRAGHGSEQVDPAHLQPLRLVRRAAVGVTGRPAQPHRKPHDPSLPPLVDAPADERAADARPDHAAQRPQIPPLPDPDDLDGEARAVLGGRGIPLQPSEDPRRGVGRVGRDLRLEPLEDRRRQLRTGSLAGRQPGQRVAEQAQDGREASSPEDDAQRCGGNRQDGDSQGRRQARDRERPPGAGPGDERERGRQRGSGHMPDRCKLAADPAR